MEIYDWLKQKMVAKIKEEKGMWGKFANKKNGG